MSRSDPISSYHDLVRHDLIRFLPRGRMLDVLELGCGAGLTGRELKRRGIARHVTGVELDQAAAMEAAQHLDVIHHADLERFELPSASTFHLVFAPDVVEHLIDPFAMLSRAVRHLVPGGHLVTSTPNVRYWRILYDLAIHGRWDYGSSGILDRTHVRFFTRRSIIELHERLGLTVEQVGYSELSGKRRIVNALTAGLGRDFLSGQHVVRSSKARL